jgi:integrase/recombinase XerD
MSSIEGRDEVHPEGSYFLQWWSNGQRTHEAAGPDAFIAAEKARNKQAELAAIRSGIIAPPEPEPEAPARLTVADVLDQYIEYVRYHRSLRTFRTYRPILASFRNFCAKTYIDEIERADVLDFATHCLMQSQKGKSIYNKLVLLSQVLKQYGRPKLLQASDWPSFVETVRPIYEDDELARLFNACAPPQLARYKFYLMSGFRDAEGRFVTWRDVDFRHSAVRVTAKPHGDFIRRTGRSGRFRCPTSSSLFCKTSALITRDPTIRYSPALQGGPTGPCSKSSNPWPGAAG